MFKFIVHVPNHIKKFLFYFLIDFVQFDYRIFSINLVFYQNFSKKKRHTRKNIYLVNKEKKILYLSPTKADTIRDFKQFKKIAVIDGMPEAVDILGDKGFIGINDLSSHKTFVPKKKPKNGFLTLEEK